MKIYKLAVSEKAIRRMTKLARKSDTTTFRLMKRYIALGILIDQRMEEDPPTIYIKQGDEIKKFVLV